MQDNVDNGWVMDEQKWRQRSFLRIRKKHSFDNRPCLNFLSYLSPKLVPITQGLILLISWTHSLLQFHLNGNYDPITLCTCIPLFRADWAQVTGLNWYLQPSLRSWDVSEVTYSWVRAASANGISTGKLQMQGQIVKETGKRHCTTENLDFLIHSKSCQPALHCSSPAFRGSKISHWRFL